MAIEYTNLFYIKKKWVNFRFHIFSYVYIRFIGIYVVHVYINNYERKVVYNKRTYTYIYTTACSRAQCKAPRLIKNEFNVLAYKQQDLRIFDVHLHCSA